VVKWGSTDKVRTEFNIIKDHIHMVMIIPLKNAVSDVIQ